MIFALLTALLFVNVTSLQGLMKPRTTGVKHAATMRLMETTLSATGVMTLADPSTLELKMQLLQLGAAMDRGQVFNPTSGLQYMDNMNTARKKIKDLCNLSSKAFIMDNIDGEWELVLSTVPHGIFRSSPFFLAIQQAYAEVGQPEKAELFFKLHELQTMSWGISKIGRVGQTINKDTGTLSSEFDTNIFALTVIPVFGWWKLLPTFGGCVITESKVTLSEDGEMNLEVDVTRAKPVKGLNTLPGVLESIRRYQLVQFGSFYRGTRVGQPLRSCTYATSTTISV